jgi:hypothetical protein
VFLTGVLGKAVFWCGVFCGEFVVNCVAEPGQLCGFAPRLKVGQDSNKYFLRALSSRERTWAWGTFGPGKWHDFGRRWRDRRGGGERYRTQGSLNSVAWAIRATGKMYRLDCLGVVVRRHGQQ